MARFRSSPPSPCTRRPARQPFARLVVAACTPLVLNLASPARAALDPAHVSGSVFFNFSPPARVDFNTFGTFPLSGPGGFIQYVATGDPAPALSGEVNVSPGFTGRASGFLTYGFQILGPAGNVPVSVTVSGGASASSTTTDPFAGFAMKAQWRLEDANLGRQQVFSEGIDTPQLSGIFNESFGHTIDLTLTANHTYLVTMVADAFAGTGGAQTRAFASALIDPLFALGPGVDPALYSFEFSPGIVNALPVPEPEKWVLVAAGVAALLLARAIRRPAGQA